MKEALAHRLALTLYRLRWYLAASSVAFTAALCVAGWSKLADFSARIDALSEVPEGRGEPRLFDARSEIFFDTEDEAVDAYRDIEARYLGEDAVLLAFEVKDDPWGAFGVEPLRVVERLTRAIEKVPYVRAVQSLTRSPWIRPSNAADRESGLLVGDFFEKDVREYSEADRLERMLAVLGAERAARLVGEARVRRALGAEARFEDHLGEPRVLGSLLSHDGRTAALMVQLVRQKPTARQLDEAFGVAPSTHKSVAPVLYGIESQSHALERIREIAEKETRYPIHVAGIPVVEKHFKDVGARDMRFLGLMFLVMILALWAAFRSGVGVALPLFIVVASISGMNGTIWLFGDLLNNMTAICPIILVAVALVGAVHLLASYFANRARFSDRRELVVHVVRANATPVFLTTLTTVVGFLSLLTSSLLPVRMLGYTAAIGTVISYLLTMTLVPAVLSILPLPEPREKEPPSKQPPSDRLIDLVIRNRRGIVAGSLAAIALGSLGTLGLRLEMDTRRMFPSSDPVVRDIEWIEEKLGGTGDLDIVFAGAPGGEPGRIAVSEAFLTRVDAFEQRLRKESLSPGSPLQTISSFESALSVLRKLHQVQNGGGAGMYRVPTSADVPEEAARAHSVIDPLTEEPLVIPAQTGSSLVSQYYLQYENGARASENLSSFVTQDRRGFRVTARVRNRPSKALLETFERIRQIAREEFPEIAGEPASVAAGERLASMRLSGKHYLFANMQQVFTNTLASSLLTSVLSIGFFIAAVYRSVLLGLVSLIPNLLPMILPFATFGILGIPLDGPAVVVGAIAMGVCVDDTIHVLTKYQRAVEQGLPVEAALKQAFREVGGAVTWTSVILVMGFVVLVLSQFRFNMMIGTLGATMIALAWVAEMVVTPAVISYAASRRRAPAPGALPAE